MTTTADRMNACRRLTNLMCRNGAASFLRLGDGELAFLLRVQQGEQRQAKTLRPSVEIAYGDPGIDSRQYARLLRAYEECFYLDLCDSVPFNAVNLSKLRWNRSKSLPTNEGPGTAVLLHDWTENEFRDFIRGRSCLFAGAEASLLSALFGTKDYRRIFQRYWPDDSIPVFHQVYGNGSNLCDNMDRIKADLGDIIRKQKIEILFLSLGGAAKPLCHELSKEHGICAIDFGSMMRALTYSGSDGMALWRSSHNPFCERIPLRLYMDALEKARPELTRVQFVAKALAQLCLDLQRKQRGTTFTADANDPGSFDPTGENLLSFKESLRCFNERYRPLAKCDCEVRELTQEFDFWSLKKGLGFRGKVFRALVELKKMTRNCFQVRKTESPQ